ELFASLAGGVKFTKLDLLQAYKQFLLYQKSKELVTINRHKGLFRCTRLPFGMASGPAIFQRMMDCVLQAVLNAPAPTSVKELQSFLGLINCYGRIIPNLATLLHPLNHLLKKT
uniref:Reverse transcriptase domain-containing protein n=1 Tax=Amphimedon queenslandica TaxID=400682 RepID=A0A1X7VJF6_AMPQE